MFIIIGIILFGIITGVLFRSRITPLAASKAMTIIIYLLLLILGISVGANETIMNNLGTLGIKALIISMAGVLGSCIFAMVIYKKLFK